nr:hypothetical protein [Tanacetum cinerariifolium]
SSVYHVQREYALDLDNLFRGFINNIKARTAAVASPAGVLEFNTYLSSEADPSESSPPLVSIVPMVSPFLCSDDSESDIKIPERYVLPTPNDAMLTRWKRRVASRSSSPTTSTPKIPTIPILPTPFAIVAPSFAFPLALMVSPPEICHSSSDHSTFRHSILGHSLPGHASPNTTVADSSTPPRFFHPSLARTPRSHATTVTSSIHATRDLVLFRPDLLPPHKRFRDSISPEDSVEEDIDTDMLEDIEADATTIEVAIDRDVVTGVNAGIDMEVEVRVDVEDEVKDEVESSGRGTMEVGVDVVAKIDIPDGMLMPDAVECLKKVGKGLQDIYEHVIEIPFQRIEEIERR